IGRLLLRARCTIYHCPKLAKRFNRAASGDCQMNSTSYLQLLFILSGLLVTTLEAAQAAETTLAHSGRNLYAVNESSKNRGSISVYDIDGGHRLIKTISTVAGVGDVRGVAVSAATGKLYVAYRDVSGTGMTYCLDVYSDTILWNRAVLP